MTEWAVILDHHQENESISVKTGLFRRIRWNTRKSILGAAGFWNYCERSGIAKTQEIKIFNDLIWNDLASTNLFVSFAAKRKIDGSHPLARRIHRGDTIIISGAFPDIETICEFTLTERSESCWGIRDKQQFRFLSGQNSVVNRSVNVDREFVHKHPIVELTGDIRSYNSALSKNHNNIFLIYKYKNTIFINLDIFSNLQAWMQGAEDISLYWEYYTRNMWLDAYYEGIKSLLAGSCKEIGNTDLESRDEKTICFRYDLDSSRDTTFAAFHEKNETPSHHGILKDKNEKYWSKIFSESSYSSCAGHYDSAIEWSLLRRAYAKLFKLNLPIKAISTGARYLTLVRNIKYFLKYARNGEFFWFFRHNSFIYYPEYLLAMERCSQYGHKIRSSTLFRGRILRYGGIPDDINAGAIGEVIGTPIPYYWPFRPFLCNDLKLAGFKELTCILEPSEDEVAGLLKADLPVRQLFLFAFHPFHATGSRSGRFCNSERWQGIIDLIEKHNKVTIGDLGRLF